MNLRGQSVCSDDADAEREQAGPKGPRFEAPVPGVPKEEED